MKTRIACTAVAVLAIAGATFAASVIKAEGLDPYHPNVQIYAGSKITGKGSMVTLCNYQEADTGHYIGQTQTFEVAFDNEEALLEYCALTNPFVAE